VVVAQVYQFMQEEILEATLHFPPLHLTVVAVEVDSVLLPLCMTEETEALEAALDRKMTHLHIRLARRGQAIRQALHHHRGIMEGQM
jgi:hypothetical protein